MDRIKEVLTYLRETNDYVSGDYMALQIGISRTAIWKYMNQLDQLGYQVSKLKGKGYRLLTTPDKLYSWEIDRYLTTKALGRKVVYQEVTDSTNSHAFRLAMAGDKEGTSVVAEQQEKGRGRLGRKWHSPVGKNLYISVVLKPFVHPTRVYPITFLSSLAVFDTVETITGEAPTLKWPNDVLIKGRKICGTLLELSTEADMVRFVVVGIGFNINMAAEDLGEEIKEKATSLFMETKKTYERAPVCGMLLSNLEKYYTLFKENGEKTICTMWEERAQIRGKYMEINQMGESYRGIAEGVDRDGAMLLNVDGKVRRIVAGDVSF